MGRRIATYPDHWCRSDWHAIPPMRPQLAVWRAGPRGFAEDTNRERERERERERDFIS